MSLKRNLSKAMLGREVSEAEKLNEVLVDNNSLEANMILSRFVLTEEEQHFIRETDKAPSVAENFSMADKYKIMSSFYLAKQIEASSITNDRHSRAIRCLTFALVIVGAISILVQVLVALLQK